MKYLKLFENFGETTPNSITIEFASHESYKAFEYKYIKNDGMAKNRGLGNNWTYTQNWSDLTDEGFSNKDGLELRPGKFYPLFINYDPETKNKDRTNSEMIFLMWGGGKQFNILSSNEHVDTFDIDREYYDELPNGRPIYCEFSNGLKVGEVDHRGYFKIVSVK